MPSPICRTVPTSARSVSTSYCSIRWRRIDVISSGRSFKSSQLLMSSRVRSSVVPVPRARWRRRGASPPAGRCRPPGRGRPSASPRPCGRPRPRSASGSPAPRRRSAHAPSSARRSGGAPRAPSVARTPSRSPRARPRGLSPPRPGGSARTAAPRRPRGRTGSRPWRLARAAGCAGRRAAPATGRPQPGRRRRRGAPARAGLRPSRRRKAPRRRWGGQPPLGGFLETREVEPGNRLGDELPVALGVERATDHPRGRLEREVGDLGSDLLERTRSLGGDLLPRVLEPALSLGLGLLAHPLLHRLPCLTRLGEDRLALAARVRDQLAVLLEQLLRLVARALGGLDRLLDGLLARVDEPLDRPERVALEHPERDQEADDRPDHQTRRDRDEGVRGEGHLTSTYARIEPSRP